MNKNIEKLRNIGIISHIDAGKTTTSERILFYTNALFKIGEVHAGEAKMDYLEQEKERGITIQSASIKCFWKDIGINLIDTPGHLDFNIEVERTLRVMDGAITLLDAVAGVEPQTYCVWRQAEKYLVSKLIYINKMDRLGADFNSVLHNIKNKLTKNVVVINFPYIKNDIFFGVIDVIEKKLCTWKNFEMFTQDIPEDYLQQYNYYYNELLEFLASHNNEILISYLNKQIIYKEDIIKTLAILCYQNKAFPVLCGSSFKNTGVNLLLDAVINFLPSPLQKTNYILHNGKEKKEIKSTLLQKQNFCGFIFKTSQDSFLGEISFCRIYSGSLDKNDKLFNSRTKRINKVSKIIRLFADKKENIETTVYSGDIVALNIKDALTGDTLLSTISDDSLESIEIPGAIVEVSITPKTKEDQSKMSIALSGLIKDDPTLSVSFDVETQQWILKGIGELHLEVSIQRLKTEKNISLIIGKPKISYRETITKSYKTEYQLKKQTGGAGQYAFLVMSIEPSNKEFEFVNKIVGGAIPKGYIPEIESSAKESLTEGPISKNRVINVKLTLLDGKFHDVDSSAMVFGIATKHIMKILLENSGPMLLEPIAELVVNTPTEYYNNIVSNLSSKGTIYEVLEIDNGSCKEIYCKIPFEKIFGYSNIIRSLSKGMASFNYKFLEYKEKQNKHEKED